MTDDLLRCSDSRRDSIREAELLGFDYVDVSNDQRQLTVHLIGRWPDELDGQDLTANVVIEGGRVIRSIGVRSAWAMNPRADEEGQLLISLTNAGDFTEYAVRLAQLNERNQPSTEPPPEFDRRYARVPFFFKIGCPSDIDCQPASECAPVVKPGPQIDYLAKDYASFRRVILDRLAAVAPDWQERHAADLGIVVAELLAYTGDRLSYLQDAVATEAYLSTARRRISIRRHLRLIDYRLHEGCNARAWLHVCVAEPLELMGEEIQFTVPSQTHAGSANAAEEVFEPLASAQGSARLTRADLKYPTALIARIVNVVDPVSDYIWENLPRSIRRVIVGLGDTPPSEHLLSRLLRVLNRLLGQADFPASDYGALGRQWQNRAALERAFPAEIARAVHPTRLIALRPAFNEIRFHLWGDEPCYLSRGATSATLRDDWAADDDQPPEFRTRNLQDLSPGDVLIFEEVIGPRTGAAPDADPNRRRAVRLTRVEFAIDPVGPQPVALVEWAAADALPFSFCLAVLGPPPNCAFVKDVTVARGNIVLADHGQTVPSDKPLSLATVERLKTELTCRGVGRLNAVVIRPAPFAPTLPGFGLTWADPSAIDGPAAGALRQDPRLALPALRVWSTPPNAEGTGPDIATDDPDVFVWKPVPEAIAPPAWARQCAARVRTGEVARSAVASELIRQWEVRNDLLESTNEDLHFVLETDDEDRSHLRFGDGEHGRSPEAGETFFAHFRVGTGPAGNLPANASWLLRARRDGAPIDGIEAVRNPFPAVGGTDPEGVHEVKLSGQNVEHGDLVRAVTPEDYSVLVLRYFGDRVQRAFTDFRELGTWTEVRVVLDPLGSSDLPASLRDAVRNKLDGFRLIGHEITVEPARYIALRIQLHVCVQPDYQKAHVRSGLRSVLGSGRLAGGRLGFFHPDNMTFGQPVLLSGLLTAASSVAGVADAQVTVFRYQSDPGEPPLNDQQDVATTDAATLTNLARGYIPIRASEVARLDSDPNDAGTGGLSLVLEGGR